MLPGFRTTIACALAVALTAVAGCTTPADGEATVRIAFLQDLSVPDHVDLVSPSFLAFDMMVQRRLEDRGVVGEVVQFDTAGDAPTAIEIAEQVAADPSFVLAVAAPFWHEPAEVARILAEAGVPTISLSPVSGSPWSESSPPPGSAAELWRRFVPDRSAEAALLAGLAARRSPDGTAQPVCLVDDGSPYGHGLAVQVERGLGDWPSTSIDASDAERAAAAVATAGCSMVVWGGFPPGARELARAMRAGGSTRGRPVDLAGDALKTTIPPTSPAGEGAVVGSVACSCVDVSTRLQLASRRFVNAYQSEHGLTPGVYAAEAWDAGRVVADSMAAGATDRGAMRARVMALTTYEGVARTYRFDERGELVGAEPRLFVAAGTRWLPLPV
jgi:ABC-type branched-subunit amino acid transport system substrate-binding protein